MNRNMLLLTSRSWKPLSIFPLTWLPFWPWRLSRCSLTIRARWSSLWFFNTSSTCWPMNSSGKLRKSKKASTTPSWPKESPKKAQTNSVDPKNHSERKPMIYGNRSDWRRVWVDRQGGVKSGRNLFNGNGKLSQKTLENGHNGSEEKEKKEKNDKGVSRIEKETHSSK